MNEKIVNGIKIAIAYNSSSTNHFSVCQAMNEKRVRSFIDGFAKELINSSSNSIREKDVFRTIDRFSDGCPVRLHVVRQFGDYNMINSYKDVILRNINTRTTTPYLVEIISEWICKKLEYRTNPFTGIRTGMKRDIVFLMVEFYGYEIGLNAFFMKQIFKRFDLVDKK